MKFRFWSNKNNGLFIHGDFAVGVEFHILVHLRIVRFCLHDVGHINAADAFDGIHHILHHDGGVGGEVADALAILSCV